MVMEAKENRFGRRPLLLPLPVKLNATITISSPPESKVTIDQDNFGQAEGHHRYNFWPGRRSRLSVRRNTILFNLPIRQKTTTTPSLQLPVRPPKVTIDHYNVGQAESSHRPGQRRSGRRSRSIQLPVRPNTILITTNSDETKKTQSLQLPVRATNSSQAVGKHNIAYKKVLEYIIDAVAHLGGWGVEGVSLQKMSAKIGYLTKC